MRNFDGTAKTHDQADKAMRTNYRVACSICCDTQVVILCRFGPLIGGRVVTLPHDRTTTVQLVMVQRDPAERTIGAGIDVVSRSIDHVDADGPAARAGLQIDDEIEAVDGHAVTDLFGEPLEAVITNRPAGAQNGWYDFPGTNQITTPRTVCP